MNQKDIKTFAGIIKEQIIFAKGLLTGKEKKSVILVLTAIAYKRADYFEKEDKKEIKEVGNVMGTIVLPLLNRKQFLKDCGVEK